MWGETLGDVVSKRDGNMAITRQNWSVAYKTFWLKIKKDEHSQNPTHHKHKYCSKNFGVESILKSVFTSRAD